MSGGPQSRALTLAEYHRTHGPTRPAPARFPYVEHRTLAEVDAAQREAMRK